ncbi:glycosyl transferase family 1 [Chamaesiphon polymorphus CCALA 037]|uniref:Glycosyl transferase family 1 n=2 Tax=Chamaesiphon TaxID=217161 RepID=A0A2T1GN32_9CYAN|nr:glycosyl transferase family 1 [Chamaesiphon polymorphus CCALA 037]
MLFDMDLGGHHGSYIQHLIEYWYKQELRGSLEIVVRPEFLQIHSDPVKLAAEYQLSNIQFTVITQDEAKTLNAGRSSLDRFTRNFQRWKLFCKYATQCKATHALHLYFDTCELPLAFGIGAPCPFSGIYFRPTFHYGEFEGYTPSWQDRLQQFKEKIILTRVLQHPQLTTLFCLDPFAVKQFDRFHTQVNVVHLADPVQLEDRSGIAPAQLQSQLGIAPNRQILLLFGALSRRKGIDELLDAISLLPTDMCSQICLLLVGGTNAVEQARIQAQVAQVCQTHPVQIVEHYDFVPEDHVSVYFQLADIVLTPYQRHVGMSGILLLAAVAGKPVLSSDYGLMGELVRRYQLGLAVDTTSPIEIAKALSRCLVDIPATLGDRSQMQIFVEQNSIDRYASTIFQNLDRQIDRTSIEIGAK